MGAGWGKRKLGLEWITEASQGVTFQVLVDREGSGQSLKCHHHICAL